VDAPMSRFFVMSAPGDTFCAIGNAMLHHAWEEPADFLYYGYDPDVAEFIRVQAFCKSCVDVIAKSDDEYQRSVLELAVKLKPLEGGYNDYLRTILPPEIDPASLHLVHIGEQAKREYRIKRWKNPQLPEVVRAWAEQCFFRHDARKSILLNPYSFQSNTIQRHWPHWVQAILWLLREFPDVRFYLTGHGFHHKFSAPNLVDLVGQTPSFMSVLALANLCDGIISTTNNLTHWAVMTGTPCVSPCVWCMSVDWYYFRKWVNVEPVRLVEYTSPIESFQAACREKLLP
jgi:hypothetical protein